MASTTYLLLPTQLKKPSYCNTYQKTSIIIHQTKPKRKNNCSVFLVARLFGPAIFEASKLNVLFLGVDERKHPGKLPRTYLLTHSDITAKLTLAISQTINGSQEESLCWLNLGCAIGYPSFVMSCSFTNQVISQFKQQHRRNS